MKNFVKTLIWLAVAYIVLTGLRLGYVVATGCDMEQQGYYGGNAGAFFEVQKGEVAADYASSYYTQNITRVRAKQASPAMQQQGAIEQAYEKVGTLRSTSYDYEKDEKSLRSAIAQYKAMTQKEQVSGLKGSRTILMAIGVPPESFDAFIDTVKSIGKLNSFEVVKTDMTGDYRKLQAKRAALIESRNSLLELKKRNGKIEELMNLETKIFELAKEIQALSAGINVFEGGKDYCTVNFTLAESGKKITIAARLLDSLEWAFGKLFLIVILALLAFVLGYVATLLIAKIMEMKKAAAAPVVAVKTGPKTKKAQ